MEVILIFYQSGGVINRYRIFSINFPSPFQFRPQAFSRFSYFLGEKLWRHDCSPPPHPVRPGFYYKRCLVSLNLQSARARFLLRRVDSFFLAGVNLALVLMTMITQMNDWDRGREQPRPQGAFPFKLGREDTPRNSWRVCAARFSDLDPSAISGQNMLEWLDLRFETRPHPFSDLAWKNCFRVNTVPRPSQVFFKHCFY